MEEQTASLLVRTLLLLDKKLESAKFLSHLAQIGRSEVIGVLGRHKGFLRGPVSHIILLLLLLGLGNPFLRHVYQSLAGLDASLMASLGGPRLRQQNGAVSSRRGNMQYVV